MAFEIMVSSAVAVGTAALIEGVKRACRRYLNRNRQLEK